MHSSSRERRSPVAVNALPRWSLVFCRVWAPKTQHKLSVRMRKSRSRESRLPNRLVGAAGLVTVVGAGAAVAAELRHRKAVANDPELAPVARAAARRDGVGALGGRDGAARRGVRLRRRADFRARAGLDGGAADLRSGHPRPARPRFPGGLLRPARTGLERWRAGARPDDRALRRGSDGGARRNLQGARRRDRRRALDGRDGDRRLGRSRRTSSGVCARRR